jgi:glucosamine--fructose-6-phosphate aminotransferase (isomerizing)
MSYLSNILEQPNVLRSVAQFYKDHPVWQHLREEVSDGHWQKIVLTGMGGSYNALFPTWLYLNQHGMPTIQIEASELVHYAPAMLSPRSLLLIVSQSGESVEIRRLMERVTDRMATVSTNAHRQDEACPQNTASRYPTIVSVTNSKDNFLSSHSDIPLFTNAGAEVGVATKTYTSSLALLHLIARSLTEQLHPQDFVSLGQVAEQMDGLLVNWLDWLEPAVKHLQTASFFSLIGRGPAIATAMNGALILKEAVRLNAEGLSGGQFRHGPMEAVSPNAGVILFANQGRTRELSERLAVDIANRGGRVVLVGQKVADANVVNLALPVVDEFLSPILEIMAIQLLAAQLAERAGLVPGQFRWSGKVIHSE